MSKNARRILAMVMVMQIIVSALPMQSTAEEYKPETWTESTDGVSTEYIASTSTSTDTVTGNTTVTVEITQTTSGTNSEGTDITGNGTSTNTTITDPEGHFVESSGSGSTTNTSTSAGSDGTITEVTVKSGYESESYIGDSPIDVPPVQNLPSVELREGETEANTTLELETPATSISGDVPENERDNTYDYTKVTVNEVNRIVEGSLAVEETVVIDPYKSNLECPVSPEDYEGKQGYTEHTFDKTKEEYQDHYWEGMLEGSTEELVDAGHVSDSKPDINGYEKGYDMKWTGSGDATYAASAVVLKEAVYLKDENGNNLIDENGDPVLDWENSKFVTGKGNKTENRNTGMILAPSQFVLEHENGNYFYAYCMDASTGAQPDINKWYNIRNLEDAIESEENPDGYISEEEAAMIRAIVTYGYWGTNGKEEDGTTIKYERDKDGNILYETDAEGNQILDKNNEPIPVIRQGSIERLKDLLKRTYGEDEKFTVHYPGKKDAYEYDIYELIDGLTEVEALAATQAAIWAYANKNDVAYAKDPNGAVTEGTVVGVLSAVKCHNGTDTSPGSWLMEYAPAYLSTEFGNDPVDKALLGQSDARMQALYQALLSLDPIFAEDTKSSDTNVIPNEDVVRDLSLVIKDKVADESVRENYDDDKNNDVYATELNFTLAFVPDKDSDDLLVCLIQGYEKDGSPIYMKDSNGDPVIRRLAGKNSEGENYDAIEADENGVYTLTGLQLGENTDHTIDLVLEGTQYLEQGVYIYQSHGGRNESQTLVGLAQGTQHVNISNTLTLNFNVDEQNHVVVEKLWSEETVEVIPPAPPAHTDRDDEESVPQPTVPSVNNQSDPEVIPEESVSLAAPVVTGDDSGIWIAVVLLAVIGIVVINLTDRKYWHGGF